MANSTDDYGVLEDLIELMTIKNVFSACSSFAMMVGGIIPFVPQYREIRKTLNADGFSLYVCLTLMVANTLRIAFWFGHPFELPLLFQSIIMNIAMLSLIHLCIKVRNKTQVVPAKPRFFTDFDVRYFWEWTDFLSYLEFSATFTAIMGIVMYTFINFMIVVEFLGFFAVFIEAMLGAPQFYRNFRKKSTAGMSKKMVFMWTLGDIFKTIYFVVKEAPVQFWICGILQVFIDILILFQIVLYRVVPTPVKLLVKGTHIS